MGKRNFTLSEIIIVIVIIGILATIGIPLYNNTLENAKAKACEINLKTILGAVEAQTLEHNSFPASLSKISDKNFKKSWAKVLKEEGAFKVKLTYFLVNLDEGGLAFAANAPNGPWIRKFISSSETLTCPSVRGGNSYGVNSSLAGKTYEEYKAEPPTTLVVGDCNSNKFGGSGDLTARHKAYNLLNETDYALAVNKNNEKVKVAKGVISGADTAIKALTTSPGQSTTSSGQSATGSGYSTTGPGHNQNQDQSPNSPGYGRTN